METTAEPSSVVILGAGFAGVRAALALAPSPGVSITLVDRSPMPAVKTRLHEMRRNVSSIPVERLFEGSRVRFLTGDVSEIDRRERRVRVAEQWVSYEWLVFALGSRTADFGIPGVRAHAIGLDSEKDALRFASTVARLAKKDARLAVVGAGPTGVEAASEAASRLGRSRVVLIEASPRILPSFARLPALYARERLRWLGVCVRTGAAVKAIEPRRVVLADGEAIDCGAVVWTAGTEPSPLLSAARLAPPGKPAAVDPFLVSEIDPRVYVIGDSAALPGSTAARPSAQIAVQQGDFVAADLERRIAGKPREPYRGEILGEFLSLGPFDATGRIHLGPLDIPVFGPPAWMAKQVGILRHQLKVAHSSRYLARAPK